LADLLDRLVESHERERQRVRLHRATARELEEERARRIQLEAEVDRLRGRTLEQDLEPDADDEAWVPSDEHHPERPRWLASLAVLAVAIVTAFILMPRDADEPVPLPRPTSQGAGAPLAAATPRRPVAASPSPAITPGKPAGSPATGPAVSPAERASGTPRPTATPATKSARPKPTARPPARATVRTTPANLGQRRLSEALTRQVSNQNHELQATLGRRSGSEANSGATLQARVLVEALHDETRPVPELEAVLSALRLTVPGGRVIDAKRSWEQQATRVMGPPVIGGRRPLRSLGFLAQFPLEGPVPLEGELVLELRLPDDEPLRLVWPAALLTAE
jgi:hypothetical protein